MARETSKPANNVQVGERRLVSAASFLISIWHEWERVCMMWLRKMEVITVLLILIVAILLFGSEEVLRTIQILVAAFIGYKVLGVIASILSGIFGEINKQIRKLKKVSINSIAEVVVANFRRRLDIRWRINDEAEHGWGKYSFWKKGLYIFGAVWLLLTMIIALLAE